MLSGNTNWFDFCPAPLRNACIWVQASCSVSTVYLLYCLLNCADLLHPAEFHSLCPNGQGLYYDEGLLYSLPAYHGKYITNYIHIQQGIPLLLNRSSVFTLKILYKNDYNSTWFKHLYSYPNKFVIFCVVVTHELGIPHNSPCAGLLLRRHCFLPCLQTLTSVLCLLMKSARRAAARTRCRATSATVNKASTMTATFSSALASA